MNRYFNSQHLAFASRQLVKFVAIHQKKAQIRTAYAPTQNLSSWSNLLNNIYKIDPSVLLCAGTTDIIKS